MDEKRPHGKPYTSGSSSGDSGSGSPASPTGSMAPTASHSSASAGNAFANDGSFMEMFKKKMEEDMRKKAHATSGDARATEQGQTSVEKKPPPVTSFVRGLAVVR